MTPAIKELALVFLYGFASGMLVALFLQAFVLIRAKRRFFKKFSDEDK